MEKTPTDLKMPSLLVPDPISSLVQLQARRLGVDLKWTGKGIEDIQMLALDNSNKTLLSKQLWNGIKELWDMPELSTLPESVYTKICSIILAARGRTELDLMKRNTKAASGQAHPTATDGGPARPP
jgi:hypothetical protein